MLNLWLVKWATPAITCGNGLVFFSMGSCMYSPDSSLLSSSYDSHSPELAVLIITATSVSSSGSFFKLWNISGNRKVISTINTHISNYHLILPKFNIFICFIFFLLKQSINDMMVSLYLPFFDSVSHFLLPILKRKLLI